jgi:hypothetical protein
MTPTQPFARQALAALIGTALAAGALAQSGAPKPATKATPEPAIELTVAPRDTLSSLSHERFVSDTAWREVARFNRLPDPNVILPGQTLRVPVRLMRWRPVAAKLVSVVGDVSIDASPGASGSSLAEGQRIQTGAGGSAVVELADGSHVRLPPSSLAEVVNSRSYAPDADESKVGAWFAGTLRVLRGSVEVFATKVLRAKPLEVTTPTAVAGVRGTHYRVNYDEAADGISRAEVLEGVVRFDAAGSASAEAGVDLHAGFGAALDASTPKPMVAALPDAPDLTNVPERFERPLVRFVVPNETSTLHLQVAEDSNFERIVRDQQATPNADVRIADLDDGQWYLRARRVGALGIEGQDAARGFVLKARPEPPAPSSPRADGKASVGPVSFSWAPNVQAAQVHLQVAEDAAFARIVADQDGLNGSLQKVQIERPGTYYWRLASVRADGDHGPYGDTLKFEARPEPAAPTGGIGEDGKTLAFHLSARPDDHELVQLARDVAFENVVVEQDLSSPEWVLPLPTEGGRYYFRYRVREPDGFVGPYSSPLVVDVPKDHSFLWFLLPLLLVL